MPSPNPYFEVLSKPSCFKLMCKPLHSCEVQIKAHYVRFTLRTQLRGLWGGGRDVRGLATKSEGSKLWFPRIVM